MSDGSWTIKEIDILNSYYPTGGVKECVKRLNRTKGAIQTKAFHLGIKSSNYNYFGNLIGKKFGRWTVLEKAGDHIQPSGNSVTMWKCQCDCGTFRLVKAGSLINGVSKSCGCLKVGRASELNLIDLTGQRFGRLIVLERAEDYVSPSSKTVHVQWLCQCDCGEKVITRGDVLRSGVSKSCGCLNRDILSELNTKDISGERFGRWTVIDRGEDYIEPNGKHRVSWNCICDCGNKGLIPGIRLRAGQSKSCGCLQKETVSNLFSEENHWNWKGGITPLHITIRCSTKYKEWRISVFERDNYTCQVSGQKGNDLEVHHIKPFSTVLEENNIETLEQALECKDLWDVDNGITLSEEWHSQTSNNELAFHKIYGTHNFTKEDFKEWFLAITPEFLEELGV